MKSILCFGDSNTHGAIPQGMPGSDGRFPWEVRWTGVLQKELGSKIRVIEEGLNGRTTVWENPLRAGRNGLAALPNIIETHSPIDLIIIMLGTNDVKARLNQSAFSIAHGASRLVEVCLEYTSEVKHILLVAPPHIVNPPDLETQLLMEGGIEKSKELATHYQYFANKLHVSFFDASTVVTSSSYDGLHWEADQHKLFALAIAKEITKILF